MTSMDIYTFKEVQFLPGSKVMPEIMAEWGQYEMIQEQNYASLELLAPVY